MIKITVYDEVRKDELYISINYVGHFKQVHGTQGRKKNKKSLGCGELGYCKRKIIIANKYGIRTPMTGTMLHGILGHKEIQEPEVMLQIVNDIYSFLASKPSLCKRLDLDYNKIKYGTSMIRVVAEQQVEYEIIPPKYDNDGNIIEEQRPLLGLVDIETDDFIIEIKTTDVLLDRFHEYIALYEKFQANNYLGIRNKKFGFVLKFNFRVFKSSSSNDLKTSKKYIYLLPMLFDEEMFEIAKEVCKELFEIMDEEYGWEHVEGPEHHESNWYECNSCPEKIKQICHSRGTKNIILPEEK